MVKAYILFCFVCLFVFFCPYSEELIFMHVLDYVIIGIYLIFIFSLGLWAGRRIKNIKEYAVANQSYGAFVLFATLSASFIGGGFSFGNADTVFNQGLMSATALWGFSLMLLQSDS